MEPTEVDIKPTIPVEDTPDKGLLALSVSAVSKLKHSRYEDVWPEDVHAAFMEAVALYPPMGKRRLKYYRVSTHENGHPSNANQTKSFGRCQLIQSYILEKTGKNRSRKQVSSHLQRLKKIHKSNPAMQSLFLERPQSSSEHCTASQTTSSQGISTDDSVDTHHLKSDPDIVDNSQNTNNGTVGISAFSYALQASPSSDSPCNMYNLSINSRDQPHGPLSIHGFLPPVLQQQSPAVSLHSLASDCPPELQDALFLKDAVNEGFRSGAAFNMPAFPTSMRRLSSRLPAQSRLDSGQTVHFARPVHTLGFQPTHQWISHGNWADSDIPCTPFTSVQEALHTPFAPLQLIPSEKRRPCPSLASEWLWQKFPDLSVDPREGSFAELCLRYPPTMYHCNHPCPEAGVTAPTFPSSPSEGEVSPLPKSISCSYMATSPASVSESVSSENTFPKQFQESSDGLASPLVIRPTPVYPISYIHSDIHSNLHLDNHTLFPGIPAP